MDVALVDPELTLPCPPFVTASSGVDALMQAVESYLSRHATPMTEALSLQAVEKLVTPLGRATSAVTPRVRERVSRFSPLRSLRTSSALRRAEKPPRASHPCLLSPSSGTLQRSVQSNSGAEEGLLEVHRRTGMG